MCGVEVKVVGACGLGEFCGCVWPWGVGGGEWWLVCGLMWVSSWGGCAQRSLLVVNRLRSELLLQDCFGNVCSSFMAVFGLEHLLPKFNPTWGHCAGITCRSDGGGACLHR